jgi:hypothetical protein
MNERFYPKSDNLGKNCLFWQLGEITTACCFPKAELAGRRSCEGLIDDVCLFIKDGIEPSSLSEEQVVEIKTRVPTLNNNLLLPPGEIS